MLGGFGFVPLAPAKAGTTLSGLPNVTPVGNVGAGEDDLMSYTIPANTFANNGDMIVFGGQLSGGGDGGGVKAYLGATELTNTPVAGSLADAEVLVFRFAILRVTSSVIRLISEGWNLGGAYNFWSEELTSINFAAALVFKCTGEGTANNDVVQNFLTGIYYPANP